MTSSLKLESLPQQISRNCEYLAQVLLDSHWLRQNNTNIWLFGSVHQVQRLSWFAQLLLRHVIWWRTRDLLLWHVSQAETRGSDSDCWWSQEEIRTAYWLGQVILASDWLTSNNTDLWLVRFPLKQDPRHASSQSDVSGQHHVSSTGSDDSWHVAYHGTNPGWVR